MKSIILSLLCFTSIICHGQDIKKSLSPFSGVLIKGSIEAELIKSNENKIEITLNNRKIEDVSIETKSDMLNIILKSSWGYSSWSKKSRITAKIYHKEELGSLIADSGSSMTVSSPLLNDIVSLKVEAGSSLNTQVENKQLTLYSGSGSTLTITGITQSADFSASAGSSIIAQSLKVDVAVAKASSGSTIKLQAINSLDAKSSSGSSIKCINQPINILNKKESSGGSVSIKNAKP
jgi:hypothetical protein